MEINTFFLLTLSNSFKLETKFSYGKCSKTSNAHTISKGKPFLRSPIKYSSRAGLKSKT